MCIFPRLASVACFPALNTGYTFPRLSAACTCLVQILVMVTVLAFQTQAKHIHKENCISKVTETIFLHTLLKTAEFIIVSCYHQILKYQ